MLQQLTSRELAEVEAYVRIEAEPVTAEEKQAAETQRLKDIFAKFNGKE